MGHARQINYLSKGNSIVFFCTKNVKVIICSLKVKGDTGANKNE